jgi:hypothetical protein
LFVVSDEDLFAGQRSIELSDKVSLYESQLVSYKNYIATLQKQQHEINLDRKMIPEYDGPSEYALSILGLPSFIYDQLVSIMESTFYRFI